MRHIFYKVIFPILLLCLSKTLTAQTIPTKLNKVGIQYSQSVRDSIGQEEGVFLNQIAAELHVKFDFSLKKVAFYTGPGAGARSDKERYFFECQDIKKYYPRSIAPLTMIYVFDNDEKEKANGYDAVIVYGSVKQFPSKKKLVRRLHRSKKFKQVLKDTIE